MRTGVAATDLKVEAPPRADLGDLAVGCFAIAKAAKQSPAKVAEDIAASFQPTRLLASASAAGPFVNFKADRPATFAWLVDAALRDRLIPTELGTGKTICIDYSSPNISKSLAFHHIRSTGIGHALAQIFRALGYRVVGINFLGDWGTTHGMLIAAWKKWGPIEPLDITALNALYVRWRDEVNLLKHEQAAGWIDALVTGGAAGDAALTQLRAAATAAARLEDEARGWFKRLEGGDPEARALWQRFRDVSWAEFEMIYAQLGIVFEEVRGESAYEPDLPGVMAELRDKGLVVESEGAQVVELEGEKTPILLQKGDGSTLYATRDFASAKYRWTTHHFTRSLYVVDRGQALHFRQLFKLLARAGYDWAAKCEHIPFGLVRLGGKKSTTRGGTGVLLKDVLREASTRTLAKITQTTPELPVALASTIADQVGIGAVLFANLVTQRDKDVDFEWDKALSLDGDSGPYLMYSHARCASIARKAGERVTSIEGVDFTKLTSELEWAVARKLLEFPEIVVRASEACEPHVVAHYLLELASEFSRWYTAGNSDPSLRVLVDEPVTRLGRLALTAAVQATLARGLSLLGMAAPEQM